jgi:CheY-like chemotaxis protein
MMRVLIIEDDENKLKQICDYIIDLGFSINITTKRSFQSGLKAIVTDKFELIIMDMSMPTFDITPSSSGGRFRTYAGKDIMEEMQRLEIEKSVIVITQFDIFGEGDNYITLLELTKELEKNYFKFYRGTVYYNASESNWKHDFEKLYRGIYDKNNNS